MKVRGNPTSGDFLLIDTLQGKEAKHEDSEDNEEKHEGSEDSEELEELEVLDSNKSKYPCSFYQ